MAFQIRRSTLATVVVSLALAASTAHAAGQPSDSKYIEIGQYLQNQERDQWLDVQYYVRQNFDDICGDTICEGEFPNIQAMDYNCAVDRTNGKLSQCMWTFLATSSRAPTREGQVQTDVHAWHCISPLAPNTHAKELLAALGGWKPIWTPLPGTSTTLWDGMLDCMSGGKKTVSLGIAAPR